MGKEERGKRDVEREDGVHGGACLKVKDRMGEAEGRG